MQRIRIRFKLSILFKFVESSSKGELSKKVMLKVMLKVISDLALSPTRTAASAPSYLSTPAVARAFQTTAVDASLLWIQSRGWFGRTRDKDLATNINQTPPIFASVDTLYFQRVIPPLRAFFHQLV